MTIINGKLALVTGASRGIGAATAVALAAKGARVLLLARSADALEQVAAQIRSAGGQAEALVVDVNDAAAVMAAAERIKAQFGVPDILINNAGGGNWLSIADTEPAQAVEMMSAPYFAAFFVTRAFIREMIARRSGHIVNVCSIASRMLLPIPAVAYTAARWALHGFTTALRGDLHGTGVKVTMYTSGTVKSTFWDDHPQMVAQLGGLDSPITVTTEQAVSAIVRGIERDEHTIIIPFGLRIFYMLYSVAPALFDALSARAMRR